MNTKNIILLPHNTNENCFYLCPNLGYLGTQIKNVKNIFFNFFKFLKFCCCFTKIVFFVLSRKKEPPKPCNIRVFEKLMGTNTNIVGDKYEHLWGTNPNIVGDKSEHSGTKTNIYMGCF